MTITLDIKPEIKDKLAQQAAAHGLAVGAYAESLLEEAAQAASVKHASPAQAKDMVELFAPLRGLNIVFESDRHKDKGRDFSL